MLASGVVGLHRARDELSRMFWKGQSKRVIIPYAKSEFQLAVS